MSSYGRTLSNVDEPRPQRDCCSSATPLATEMCVECAFQFRWTNAPYVVYRFFFNHTLIASSTMPCCVKGRSLSLLRIIAASRRALSCFLGICTLRVARNGILLFVIEDPHFCIVGFMPLQ